MLTNRLKHQGLSMRLLILPVLIMLSLSACNSYTPTTQVNESIVGQQTLIAPDLQVIIDQSWALNLAYSPELAASLGDATAAGKLDDLSAETLAKKKPTDCRNSQYTQTT